MTLGCAECRPAAIPRSGLAHGLSPPCVAPGGWGKAWLAAQGLSWVGEIFEVVAQALGSAPEAGAR